MMFWNKCEKSSATLVEPKMCNINRDEHMERILLEAHLIVYAGEEAV